MICTISFISNVHQTCRPFCTNDGKRPIVKTIRANARTYGLFSIVRFPRKRAEQPLLLAGPPPRTIRRQAVPIAAAPLRLARPPPPSSQPQPMKG